MQMTLIRKTPAGAQLRRDDDALNVLSAALQFTLTLNPRCEELAKQFESLLPPGPSIA